MVPHPHDMVIHPEYLVWQMEKVVLKVSTPRMRMAESIGSRKNQPYALEE